MHIHRVSHMHWFHICDVTQMIFFPRQMWQSLIKESLDETDINPLNWRSNKIIQGLIDVSFVPLWKNPTYGYSCQMSVWESLANLIWFTSCVDRATQMICLAMAIINHRQPEGTASTHGKASGWHIKAPTGLFMCEHVCARVVRIYIP